MKCVVPLAGPDIWSERFGLRPMHMYEGEPLLLRTLKSRAWVSELRGADYIFVVRDIPETAPLMDFLQANWPGCNLVKLSALTGGAMFSALSGVCLVSGDDVIVVDLADIIFDADPEFDFTATPDLGMVVPAFISSDPEYSYLREENGRVVEAREKQVISNKASAGVYIFRNRAVYIQAVVHSLLTPEISTYKGIFFVCPMVNGILNMKLSVSAPLVADVVPVGKMFHTLSSA